MALDIFRFLKSKTKRANVVSEEKLKNDILKATDAYIAKQAGKAIQKNGSSTIVRIKFAKENKNVIEVKKLLFALYNYRAYKTYDDKSKFEIPEASYSEVWADYEQSSISYYTILEQLRPGITGENQGEYKLPKELSQEIFNQNSSLNGLKVDLRRYQEWGVKFALHQHNILLGDEMGLGKTVQAIATMLSLRNEGATSFLVVCPLSVLTNWIREVNKMSDLPVIKIHGNDRESCLEKWKTNGGVAITTYETTEHFELSEDFRFSMLVVDEAHYIKNPSAKRTKNVISISEHADRKLFMTGTAIENNFDEMINLIDILNPDVSNEIKKLKATKMLDTTISSMSGEHKDLGLLKFTPEFQQVLAPVYFRREREEVLGELPELIESKEWCTLLPEEKKIYRSAVLHNKFTESRRVSWNIDDLEKSSKAIRLKELVDEASLDGRKVIVFSFFLDTIAKIQALLGDQCVGTISGSIPPAKRQEIIDAFSAAPKGSVLVSQIQAGGTGLNIQCASVVILCEPQLKPSIENQAISRAYRMGQTRSVLVYRLLCDNTIDEDIVNLLEDKQKVFDAFAGDSISGNESLELDEKTLGNIMQEEAKRILADSF